MTEPASNHPGRVVLVGAGPGDPGLITVAGLDWLRRADVVIYDALSNARLLDHVKPDTLLIDAGKRAREHKLTQDQINDLLLEHAHVFTLGARGDTSNILADPASIDAEVVTVDRGGDVFVVDLARLEREDS